MLESSFNPHGGDTSVTLCPHSGATLPLALLQHYCFSHTEEQLVAKKHLNAVYPVLNIHYCGVLPIHIVSFPLRASCFVQIRTTVIYISLDVNANQSNGQSLPS